MTAVPAVSAEMAAPFANPVVRGVAPDPSVCRVGDDFFLATSSFDFWPGVPIRHSTDLVNWRLIGHAITRPAQFRRDGVPGPVLLFAPTLRFHDGRFFVTCTNMAPQEAGHPVGNFIVHADDPAGAWSDAAWVDQAGFDPSLTFADGTCYFTRRTLNLANATNGLGPVVQAEVDPFTGRLARHPVAITEGDSGFCSNDIEGPHLYKIGELYYLFSAEGGTERGHMQTCARSRSPWGPFEPCPHNPVLTHRHLVMHPIQCTGHAELIDAPDGSWWALFLATRADRTDGPQILGRETFLAPVRWEDGWPIIGERGRVELDMKRPRLAAGSPWPAPQTPWTAGWTTRQLPLAGIEIDGDRITLPVTPATLDQDGAVAAAFVRQLEHAAAFEATLAAVPASGAAGVTVYTAPEHHYDLIVSGVSTARSVTLRRRAADLAAETHVPIPGRAPVTLRIDCDGARYRFWADDVVVGSGSARLLDAHFAPGFGSVRFGVLAVGAEGGLAQFADVHGEGVG